MVLNRPEFQQEETAPDDKFTITHIGTLYESRNPTALWQALKELCEEVEGFSDNLVLRLVGMTDPGVLDGIQKHNLDKQLDDVGYLAKTEVPRYQQKASVLLLIYSEAERTIIPGKLFEYLAARRYILCIGQPEWDAPQIIARYKAGSTVPHHQVKEVKSAVRAMYDNYLKGEVVLPPSDLETIHPKKSGRKLCRYTGYFEPGLDALTFDRK